MARTACAAEGVSHANCRKVIYEILQVLVEMQGREALHIDLPLGVDARQGKARHMDAEQRLILELPFKSYRTFTEVGVFVQLDFAKCLRTFCYVALSCSRQGRVGASKHERWSLRCKD